MEVCPLVDETRTVETTVPLTLIDVVTLTEGLVAPVPTLLVLDSGAVTVVVVSMVTMMTVGDEVESEELEPVPPGLLEFDGVSTVDILTGVELTTLLVVLVRRVPVRLPSELVKLPVLVEDDAELAEAEGEERRDEDTGADAEDPGKETDELLPGPPPPDPPVLKTVSELLDPIATLVIVEPLTMVIVDWLPIPPP